MKSFRPRSATNLDNCLREPKSRRRLRSAISMGGTLRPAQISQTTLSRAGPRYGGPSRRVSQLTVTRMVVVAVIDGVATSVPTIVTVYVPLLALWVDEVVLEHPAAANAAPARSRTAPAGESRRDGRWRTGEDRMAAHSRRIPHASYGREFLRERNPGASQACRGAVRMAAVVHADELVYTFKVAVTAFEPETVAFASEKQPFVKEGLLETVKAMVPV